jgi:cohesin complex subunit SA-1/2
MFLEGAANFALPSISLAKAFSSTLVFRGARLSITRRLDSEHVVQIHNTLLTWIIKRIVTADRLGDKRVKSNSIEFFRVLHALLTAVDSHQASQM